ncbi:MAG: CehA/McbA family metallohydrolase [Planctomycetota bacterium]
MLPPRIPPRITLDTFVSCFTSRVFWFSLAIALILAQPVSQAETGKIQFHVRDEAGQFLPCRIHLHDPNGNAVRAFGQPFWNDHFACSGAVAADTPPGKCKWIVERGPEYRSASGSVSVVEDETSEVNIVLERITSLRDEGWYSGDLHVHRPVEQIKSLMLAEDLHFAPVIGWWNTPAPNAIAAEQTEFRFDRGRVYCKGAGEDEREGGALLFFGLKKPLDLTVKSREYPSPMKFVQLARNQNRRVWIDIEKPFWWDLPTWLAVASPNSVGIAHNHMHRSGVLGNEAWGKTRDEDAFPGVKGNGLWTQQIYYHILNCGLQLPPSAGSASGVLPNPVGYNRTYVQLGKSELTRDRWFNALQAGRCFVTNGPLLRVTVNEKWPGATIKLNDNQIVELEIKLTSNDPIESLEVIENGSVRLRIPCTNETEQSHTVQLKLDQPGWLLVRAIANVDHTFRFASTAPWYLEESNGSRRISARSVRFMLRWLNERIGRVEKSVADEKQRASVLHWHHEARHFWTNQLERANAD